MIEGSVGVGGGGGVTLCLIGSESMLLARWIASHNPRCHIADRGIYFVSRLINGANDSVPSRRRPGSACTALREPTNQKSAFTPMGRLRDGFFDLKPLTQIDERKLTGENAPRVVCYCEAAFLIDGLGRQTRPVVAPQRTNNEWLALGRNCGPRF